MVTAPRTVVTVFTAGVAPTTPATSEMIAGVVAGVNVRRRAKEDFYNYPDDNNLRKILFNMLALYQTLSLRYLRLRWGLNALVVLSIALGVSVWVATSALYQSLEQSILVSVNPMAGFADLMVSNGDPGVPADLQQRLASVPGVKAVRPLVVASVHIVLDDNRLEPVIVLGVERSSGGEDFSLPDVRVGEIDKPAAVLGKFLGAPPPCPAPGCRPIFPPARGASRCRPRAASTTSPASAPWRRAARWPPWAATCW